MVVALRKESVDRNTENAVLFLMTSGSLSARRAWIEIFAIISLIYQQAKVALRKESVDRNTENAVLFLMTSGVALRKESVDRNTTLARPSRAANLSLSARRAWIEIRGSPSLHMAASVALRKESVDRNKKMFDQIMQGDPSLSARRAWIEILLTVPNSQRICRRSPQGERG